MQWRIAPDMFLDLGSFTILGIVNATPDSFSDGGSYPTTGALLAHAGRQSAAGARVLDVGGASSRPGAKPVSEEEERRRIVPLIEALVRDDRGVLISVDTTRAAVAEAALDAGAMIINDISGGTEDPAMLPLMAARGCGVILMHRVRPPAEDRYSDEYEEAPLAGDVVALVAAALQDLRAAALEAGVADEAIVLDPGLGFGKTVEQNLALIAAGADRLAGGRPLLGAASRKSFIGAVTGVPAPAERVAGSIAVTLDQHRRGVRLFRVHDVAAHHAALAMAEAVSMHEVAESPH